MMATAPAVIVKSAPVVIARSAATRQSRAARAMLPALDCPVARAARNDVVVRLADP